MMGKYNLTLVLRPEVKDEARDKFVTKIEKTLKGLDGSVTKTVDMGRKQLAYKIQNLTEGIYVNMNLEAPKSAVVELAKKLAVDKDILRHLLVKSEV